MYSNRRYPRAVIATSKSGRIMRRCLPMLAIAACRDARRRGATGAGHYDTSHRAERSRRRHLPTSALGLAGSAGLSNDGQQVRRHRPTASSCCELAGGPARGGRANMRFNISMFAGGGEKAS